MSTYDQIMSDLRQKKYAPVYLLMGDEPYYIDVISDYMQKNILDATEQEFDFTVVYGKDTDMRSVINMAKAFPMMAQHKLVIVKEAQNIKEWDLLQFYMQQPLLSTILVFCYKYGKVDSRKKFVKDIQKSGVLFESTKLRDYQIAPWIKNYVHDQKKTIDDKAVAILSESLGTDLSKIVNELQKLLISESGSTKTITAELVERNIGISKDYNVFELQNALINGNVLKANRIIRYFSDNPKANPMVLVLGQLFNFFANLMIFHYLSDKSQGNVAAVLKINPYFVKDYQMAAQRFNAWKTMNIISWIRETDARCKGVDNPQTSDGDLLKELIFKILH